MKSVLSPHGYPCALPRRGLRSPKGKGGFTLVELIAVIAIMAILAASVIGGVIYAGRRAANAATKGLIQRLSVAINIYHEDYGDYPPDRRPTGGWSGWYMSERDHVNDINMPAETLWYFLAGIYQEPREGDPDVVTVVIDDEEFQAMARKTAYMDFRETDLRRTGIWFSMSASLTNQNDSDSRDDEFPEIVDAWGTPINYRAKDMLNTADPLVNDESFDLVSRGPDRFTGGSYNNRNWKHNDIYPNRDNISNFRLQ